MKFHTVLLFAALESANAFYVPTVHQSYVSTSALDAKSRKARRMQKVERQNKGRSKQFYDAIEEAQGKEEKKETKEKPDEEEQRRAAIIDEAQQRMEKRPEVSTTVIDDETGIEVIAQGQSVLDVVTRKAVKLSDRGPEYRLAQMFPGVPPDIREKYRLDWSTVEIPEVVEALRNFSSAKLEDGSRGIPPRPSVTNSAIDFVLANRDRLGLDMQRALGRLTMKIASEGKDEEAKEMNKLWLNYLTVENHISAPFRQIMQDAEGRVGPNFGNLDLMKYCKGELYERVGNYLVLKGMVAHWEKKVVDADFIEKNPRTDKNFNSVLGRGDPKRYLPNPPILYTLKECTQVCAMAQQMCKLFVETEELFGDFPPEIVFLEESLKIRGGTALRKYMIDEFCPARGITPAGLIEGMRRFCRQLENMQIDPYADLTNKVEDLHRAMAVGTEEARDPYEPFVLSSKPGDIGYFQTYTFNHPKKSLVRFLDNSYRASELDILGTQSDDDDDDDDGEDFLGLGGLFNLGQNEKRPLRTEPKPNDDEEGIYKVPEARSAGRPHDLGWFERLNAEAENIQRLGEVPPGRIIPDE